MLESINLNKDFPQIEDITGIVEVGPMGSLHRDIRNFTKSNLPTGKIYCESTVCEGGGIDLESIFRAKLSDIARRGQTVGELHGRCVGHEYMGNGHWRDCLETVVAVKIRIKYREQEIEKQE